MRVWSEKEDKRQKWKKRIESVQLSDSRDTTLRDFLLKCLNGENPQIALQKFEKERDKLLSPKHGQKNHWTPHAGWFWRFLRYLGLFSSTSAAGSTLRLALATIEAATHQEPSIKETILDAKDDLANDVDFETALFEEPARAEKHTRALVNLEQNNEPDKTLERLYALRLRLTPLDYFGLMRQISSKFPTRVFVFLYQHYDEKNESLDEHTYAEIYWMVQLLLPTNHNNPDTRAHIYRILTVLILIQANLFKNLVEKLRAEPTQDIKKALAEILGAPEDPSSHYAQIAAKLPQNTPVSDIGIDRADSLAYPMKLLEELSKSAEGIIAAEPFTKILIRTIIQQLLMARLHDKHSSKDLFEKQKAIGQCCLNWLVDASGISLTHPLEKLPINTDHRPVALSPQNDMTLREISQIPSDSALLFSSFKRIEENWIPTLLFDMAVASDGLNSTIRKIVAMQPADLKSVEKDWIIERLRPHCSDEQIEVTRYVLDHASKISGQITAALEIQATSPNDPLLLQRLNSSLSVFEEAPAALKHYLISQISSDDDQQKEQARRTELTKILFKTTPARYQKEAATKPLADKEKPSGDEREGEGDASTKAFLEQQLQTP